MRLLACLFSLVATFATAADLTLTAIDGTTQVLPASADGKPTLLFFVSPFCSTTKSFAKEIQQITVDHSAKVRVLIIECDPEVTRDIAIEHATVSEFTAPVLLDADQALTKLVKATITPEAVLLDAKGAVYYQGRINDLYLGPTKRQRAATTRDLRDAIEALLASKPAPQPQPPAQGCKISVK